MTGLTEMPTRIRVGYRVYAVQEWGPLAASSHLRLGECDHLGLVIRVRSDIPASVKAEVLLHEVLHCAYWGGCIEDKDDEERTVSVLANVMTQVWRDNAEFVDFMSQCLFDQKTKPSE